MTSQPGKGSTFKFFLPVQTAPAETPPINQSAVWPILTASGQGTAIASDVPHATQIVGRQEEMPDAPSPTAITQPTETNNHSSKIKPSHTEIELHILVVEVRFPSPLPLPTPPLTLPDRTTSSTKK